MLKNLMARIFSSRVRELEQELERVNNDLRALGDEDFRALSLARMSYTPETGLQASFQGASIAHIMAAWAMNTLSAVDAKNYVEFDMVDRETMEAVRITVQRARGEGPGQKAARLERELAAIRAA